MSFFNLGHSIHDLKRSIYHVKHVLRLFKITNNINVIFSGSNWEYFLIIQIIPLKNVLDEIMGNISIFGNLKITM